MKDKKMTKLYDQLMEANRNDNTEEQNRLFAEMESLDPKHEKVFQAKVTFLQDDDDWEGAHKVLEECVGVIPSSAYCLKRLANIRSSTIDDRIRYGNECLQVAKDDPSCIVDLAIALRSKGELAKSKDYFEQALSLPSKGEGYDRPYVLYHYGFTLEELGLAQKSKAAFAESCRLHWKPACEKLKAS
jgi:tetratricopeptide (TPR) repeat protein